MPTPTPAPSDDEIREIIAGQLHLDGPLLPIFHALQAAFGHVPQAALQVIAKTLNITRAEVHGVLSFYHDFREVPAGRHVVKICRAEACQAVGGDDLAARTLEKLGTDWHGTTANGAVTIEPVYCLGLCACGPAAMVDNRVVGRLDDEKMAKLLAEAGA